MVKIFNLSLHRSATQSVTHFFRLHGFSAAHWPGKEPIARCENMVETLDTVGVWKMMLPTIEANDVFSDVPYNFLYREALDRYPDAKFFLILRDTSKWLRSVRNHIGDGLLDNFEKFQYWPYADTRKPKLIDYTDEELLTMYRLHRQAVDSYLAANHADFRIFMLESPSLAEEIGAFAGFRPNQPFPNRDWDRPG